MWRNESETGQGSIPFDGQVVMAMATLYTPFNKKGERESSSIYRFLAGMHLEMETFEWIEEEEGQGRREGEERE